MAASVGFGQHLDLTKYALPALGVSLRLNRSQHRELIDIGARHERLLTRAGHDQRAHIRLAPRARHRVAQLEHCLTIQRIQFFRPVHSEQRDTRVTHFKPDVAVRHMG